MGATPRIGYGGQAVLEGVMMRGRRYMAVAVRAPDRSIVLHSEPLPIHLYSGWVSRVPLLRGVTMLWDSLVLGLAALTFSADVALREEGEQPEPRSAGMKAATWGSIVVALVLGIGLFFVLPLLLVGLYERAVAPSFWSHLVETAVRLGLLVGYVYLVGFTREIHRVYQYHGAEHKTIHAFEHGDPLQPATIQRYPTAHPRCGTAFLLLVVLVSIVVFALIGTPDLATRIASRVLLIPVIAGIAYEILRFGGYNYEKSPLVRLTVLPGILLQGLTTKQPDDEMVQVAIAAFKEMQRLEEGAQATVPGVATEPSGTT
jgi:uncharacterized protein YqhQ